MQMVKPGKLFLLRSMLSRATQLACLMEYPLANREKNTERTTTPGRLQKEAIICRRLGNECIGYCIRQTSQPANYASSQFHKNARELLIKVFKRIAR